MSRDEDRVREQYAQRVGQTNPQSHLRPGGVFDRQPKLVVLAEDEEKRDYTDPKDARQAFRRAERLSEMVGNALTVDRVDPGASNDVMRVTFDEFERVRQDPDFEPLGKYAPKLLNYEDGTPRKHPIRPLLQNELGMYKGRMVVLTNNPGDGARDAPLVGMTSPEEYRARHDTAIDEAPVVTHGVVVEPDPFPSPKDASFLSTNDDDELP